MRLPIGTVDRLYAGAGVAFSLLEPSVKVAIDQGMILRPGLAFEFARAINNGQCRVVRTEEVGTLGDPKFAQTAHRKNLLTGQFHMPSHMVQAAHPELIDFKDTQWEGNAYCSVSGLMVACSAASGRVDRGFAEAGLALWKMQLGNEMSDLIITARALKTASVGDARGLTVA